MSNTSSVLVGCLDRTAWVKVSGRGTFENSAGLKKFAVQMIRRGYRDFVADLRDCDLMDSTFMGTLAGIELRLREIGQGHLRAVNVNERNAGLLSSLGLDQVFSVEPIGSGRTAVPGDTQLVEAPQTAAGGAAHKQTVLEAHEALVEADAANAVKFHDVLEFLRQELNVPSTDSEG